MTLDRVEPDHSVLPAPSDIPARAGIVRAGTVAATCWRWHAVVDGRRLVTLSVNWIMGNTLPGFETYDQWKIAIRGKPGIDIAMNIVEPENTGEKTGSSTPSPAPLSTPSGGLRRPAGIFHFPLFAPYRPAFRVAPVRRGIVNDATHTRITAVRCGCLSLLPFAFPGLLRCVPAYAILAASLAWTAAASATMRSMTSATVGSSWIKPVTCPTGRIPLTRSPSSVARRKALKPLAM